jgi:hypothetical protein
VSTVVGGPGKCGYVDGPAGSAKINYVWGITPDTAGNLYITEQATNTIRKIDPSGAISTLAGDPYASTYGSSDGVGSAAQFTGIAGLQTDHLGNMYVADSENGELRKVTPGGVVTTIAGTASDINNGVYPMALPGKMAHVAAVAIINSSQLVVSTWDGYAATNMLLGINLPTIQFASFLPGLVLNTSAASSRFTFTSWDTLGTGGDAFNPRADVVLLKFGTVSTLIPAGSFKPNTTGGYGYTGKIGQTNITATVQPDGPGKYRANISGTGANLSGVTNPVAVTLNIGNNTGTKSVTATFK